LSQYADIPVLSVTAPFKSGFNGSTDFTDVMAGNVAINNAADLYLYANTIYAVKVLGSDIKNWLERSAGWFNQIDPTSTADQQLINPSFPGYNFDTFTSSSISYKIDVTQPAYDPTKPTVPGNRIVNLQYNGVAIDPNATFIVATNNYRAGGGGSFPGLDGTKTIIASADANRDVLIAYIKSTGTLTYAANGAAKSWGFVAPASQAGRVIFFAAPNRADLITSEGIKGVKQEADAAQTNGNVTYSIDLTKQ
jgi:2',3'-cyclic-nucleotide 2'-phosphodiesterase/3'-nucleotidase